MSYPFHVSTNIHPVELYQLEDGRFQMIKKGKTAPLMVGFGYVIVENLLANFLKELDIDSVEFKDAIIWNRGEDIEYYDYTQIFIKRHFTADQIRQLNLAGLRMFVMNNNSLFVTPSLKKVLSESDFKYLKFSKGLSLFA